VLGLVVMKREKQWEAPVMSVLSFVQFCLATMLVGFAIGGNKIGSNPFVMLRNEFDLRAQIPMLAIDENYTNYLSFIKDGNDLNPLLQNYWMQIHPPVLFLGFASTVIPFAFAIAALWTRDVSGWINRVLPWSLFSAGIFALGIMMGAAWAYESLNFGGYWAWDPVENASLVPWLVLVAGVHTVLIYKHTGYSLHSSFSFLILSFLLVVYATFLTRSGILGDTSVHAFTDLGMNAQIFCLCMCLCGCRRLFRQTARGPNGYIRAWQRDCLLLTYFVPFVSFLSIITGIVLLMVNLNKHLPPAPKKGRRNVIARVLDVCRVAGCFSFGGAYYRHDVHPGF
jgi:cytochrome c-type biogenesis protein CcmF